MGKPGPVQLSRSSPPKRGSSSSVPVALGPRLRGDERNNVCASALYRLMAWLSPAYPVGAFSYSSGLEWAVEAGEITTADALGQWLAVMLTRGAGFCDAVFFAQAYRACAAEDDESLRSIAELAAAMTPSRERFLETTAQGGAFLDTTRATWPCPILDRLVDVAPGPITYPIAVAATAAGHDVPLEPALGAYLQALAANWVSAGVRLIPLGQTDGQRTIAALESVVAATAGRALAATLDDVGSATFRADIASMRHETQYTRLFRS
jgi:urease accessory protein